MHFFSLLPKKLHIRFTNARQIAYSASVLSLLGAGVLLGTINLNYGIDFRGGTLIEIDTHTPADIAVLRKELAKLNLGDIQIQEFGAPHKILIRIEALPDGQSPLPTVQKQLGDSVDYQRVEVVGPKVSGELVRKGLLAVVSTLLLVMIYIWVRFEWQFSIGAVLALAHDVGLTVGALSLLRIEFNLPIIAAILITVGYSLNDTVVVYDRVRENLRKFKKMPLNELIDLSLNQTLARTLMTSLTTLLALTSLFVLGSPATAGFTLTMIWGVLVGTYSSVFIAAPLLLHMRLKRDWSQVATS